MTPLQLITNWFLGNLTKDIPPYWSLDAKNVAHFKGGVNLCQMRKFMKVVEGHGRKVELWKAHKS